MSLLLVVGAVVVVSFVAVVVMLDAARRRPLTVTDLYCAALDDRLTGETADPRPARARDAGGTAPGARGTPVGARGARSAGVAV
jgi:hypothetical protein